MSRDRDTAEDKEGAPDQQQQSGQHTGAGASTAMEAMLKKRGMQTREPEVARPQPPAPDRDPAASKPRSTK